MNALAPITDAPFPVKIIPTDTLGSDPLRFAVYRAMINDPKLVKAAIYPGQSVDWYGAPHWLPHEGGEDLDQMKHDAFEALDAKPSAVRASYLEAALDAIEDFEQQRRNRL